MVTRTTGRGRAVAFANAAAVPSRCPPWRSPPAPCKSNTAASWDSDDSGRSSVPSNVTGGFAPASSPAATIFRGIVRAMKRARRARQARCDKVGTPPTSRHARDERAHVIGPLIFHIFVTIRHTKSTPPFDMRCAFRFTLLDAALGGPPRRSLGGFRRSLTTDRRVFGPRTRPRPDESQSTARRPVARPENRPVGPTASPP